MSEQMSPEEYLPGQLVYWHVAGVPSMLRGVVVKASKTGKRIKIKYEYASLGGVRTANTYVKPTSLSKRHER